MNMFMIKTKRETSNELWERRRRRKRKRRRMRRRKKMETVKRKGFNFPHG